MTTVKDMPKAVKQLALRMNPLQGGERSMAVPDAKGTGVTCAGSLRVSDQYLSECEAERALTQDLISRVTELSNLAAACRQVVKNGGSPGLDGFTVKELEKWFADGYRSLQDQLQESEYQPWAVKGVEIPKAKGGMRQLGIPTVKDRLVQQAVSRVLSRGYEKVFSDHSYGFRPKRSAHDALKQAGLYVSEGYNYVVDIDLEKFFDRVNHDRLMWLLGKRIGDKKLLRLTGQFLKAGILKGGLFSQRLSGTPQGSPLSPLLSNIVLDELDRELEKRGHRFVRYADDLIIMVRSEAAANRVMESITVFIENRLKLKVNREKSRVCRPHELNYLGHTILLDGSLGLSRESESRLKSKLRELTRRNRGISLDQLIQELNPKLRGWLQYFRYARMDKRLVKLESWLRRKIRCFRLKQCKRAIGIVRFMKKLGVPEWRAWLFASSGKGWFRKSGHYTAHEGMNLKWFASTGLFNMVKYYRSKFRETALYESTQGGVRGR